MGISHDRQVPSWDGSPSGPNWNAGGDMLGRGLGDGLRGLVGGLTDAIKGIFTPGGIWDPIAQEMQFFRDQQEDLAEETDLLSPLLDYGSSYIDPNNRGPGGVGPVPFTKQLGPMRGCEMINDSQGGIRLLDKGLWDMRVHVSMDAFFSLTASGQTRLRLEVFTPGGQLYSEQVSNLSHVNVLTLTVSSSVVVPEPGYLVRARLSTNQSGRKPLGGPAWSRLTVQHIARDVDGPWSKGNEDSNSESTS